MIKYTLLTVSLLIAFKAYPQAHIVAQVNSSSKEYDSTSAAIASPRLVIGGQTKIFSAYKVVLLKAGYGVEGAYRPIRSPLIVTCEEKVFYDTAYCYRSSDDRSKETIVSTPDYVELYNHPEKLKAEGYDFFMLLHTEKCAELKGRKIKVTMTDPRTGAHCTKTFTIVS